MSWSLVRLGDICNFVRGPFGGALKKESFVEDGFAVYEQQHAIYNQFSDIRYYIDSDKFEDLKRFELHAGDIIMSCSGTMGKVAVVPDGIKQGIINQALLKLTPNCNLDIAYFMHWLKSESFQFQLGLSSHGAAIKNVASVKVLKELEIPLPPLEEQKRIAAILDKAHAIRQKRKQAIDLADEFLRSVFLDMFGEYLGASSNVVSFGDVTKLDAKMVDPTLAEYTNLLHIGPDRIEKRTGEILPALTAREEGLKSKKFLFSEQYVIYSKIRPYLRKAAIPDFVALCSADMYPIKPVESKVTREFIWALLLSDFFDNYVCTLPDRASIPKLNKKELAAFQFSLPPYEEIQKFSDIAKETLKNKTTQQAHQSDAKSLFNALSQKAFSGQL
ncbi:restriction endonuclease subunit S [Vibrio parahaemolyticus]|nr:restriction endonuclease subunit S [Vibrio parahaemolyticus]EHH2465208.1 restriction endonuclease subunit S [Vibrio parahaemolyticus]